MHKNVKDLTGRSFGRLTVIKDSGERQNGNVLWLCQCCCGQQVKVLGFNLKSGHTSSCGCLNREVAAARQTKHGMGNTRLYRCWINMIQRCTNPNAVN